MTTAARRAYTAAWKSRNRPRVRELNRASYCRRLVQNPDLSAAYQRTFAAKRRGAIAAVKARPCADCGVLYPHYVMDLDHRERATKTFAVSAGFRQEWSVVLAEIEKCDVVCSNCHRERTHQQIKRGPREGQQ